MSDSVQPHRRQPTRLPHPWDSPGKNTGVGYHFLLQRMKVKSESEVAQSCQILSNQTLPNNFLNYLFVYGCAGSSLLRCDPPPLVTASGGSSAVPGPHCGGFSCGARAERSHGLWSLSGPGVGPVCPAFPPTVPRGKSSSNF